MKTKNAKLKITPKLEFLEREKIHPMKLVNNLKRKNPT